MNLDYFELLNFYSINDTDVEQIALKCYCGSVEFKSWFFNIPYKDPEFLKLIPGLEQ